jgi:hypothetical protein
VEAGRRNRRLWRGFSAGGLERLREAALAGRPWEHATGPRTPEGKARAAANGKLRQTGPVSARGLKAEVAEFHALARRMAALRSRLADTGPSAVEG